MNWPFVTRRTHETLQTKAEAWREMAYASNKLAEDFVKRLDQMLDDRGEQDASVAENLQKNSNALTGLTAIVAQLNRFINPGERLILVSADQLATIIRESNPPKKNVPVRTTKKPTSKRESQPVPEIQELETGLTVFSDGEAKSKEPDEFNIGSDEE